MNNIRVLIIEDNENDMELIKAELLNSFSYNFQFKWVVSKKEFISALKEFNPDIVLSDYNLPSFNGLEAIALTLEKDHFLPIIIITGTLKDEIAVACIQAGAWDYVVKDKLQRLHIAFENALKLKTEKLKNRKIESEIKLIKEKIDLQLKLLYDAIDRAPSSFVITDKDASILYVNPKFEEVSGYKKEQIIGKNPRILQSGTHTIDFYKSMWSKLVEGKEWKGEILNKKKNGDFYWSQTSIAPITDEEGNINYFVAIEHDITELIKAKENAEESNKLKSIFLATMSHELRTPLNSIIGFTSLINNEMSTSEILDMNKKINYSANHLLNLVQSILDISIIQAKEIKITKDTFSLKELFSNLKDYLNIEQIRLNKENISTKFIYDSNLENLAIKSDKMRIIQILSNLLNNALKFTSEGVIEYGYTIKDTSIIFFVKDSGIGIPKDKLNTIFEKFRQLDDRKTRNYDGIGLGLSICKELVNLLESKLEIESEVTKGSTFSFTLNNILIEKPMEQKKDTPTLNLNLKNKNILIAEDTELNYILLNKMLTKTEANILWAKDGQEAIDIVKENANIDLILMDIMMPNVDGYEATIKIKKIRPDIYIVAQTAHTLESEIEKIFEVGCDYYISKPIRKELLYDALRRIKTKV